MRPTCLIVLTACGLAGVNAEAGAQVYPSRPVTLVVPWPTGGPSDGPARLLAERMRAALGQSVIVENLSGASGSAGTGRVARATPDGYTLVQGNFSTHVINGAVFKLSYDVQKDFEPISPIGQQSFLITTKKTMPAKTLSDLRRRSTSLSSARISRALLRSKSLKVAWVTTASSCRRAARAMVLSSTRLAAVARTL
jgi:tripartite-type tricarboxylate transporter receptor subunit TctC